MWFLHREVSVNILTQGGLQLKTQSIDCIDSLKLMKCQNQSNHVCLKSDHLKMTVLHTLLDQHKEERPHLATSQSRHQSLWLLSLGVLKGTSVPSASWRSIGTQSLHCASVQHNRWRSVPESSAEYECSSWRTIAAKWWPHRKCSVLTSILHEFVIRSLCSF